MGLDQELFLYIQGFTGNQTVDSIFLFMAETLVLMVPIALIYLWFKSEDGRKDSVFTFIATISGILFTYFMGIFYFHNQPFSVYNTIVAEGGLDNAFPSQHTATMFSCFWSFLYLKRMNLAKLFGIAGFLTGFGRIFVGLHYPLDILGGILSGLVGVFLAYLFIMQTETVIDAILEQITEFEEEIKRIIN